MLAKRMCKFTGAPDQQSDRKQQPLTFATSWSDIIVPAPGGTASRASRGNSGLCRQSRMDQFVYK
jgi:hypothetical protein